MILNIQKKKEKIPLIFKQFKLYDNKKPELWRHEMNSNTGADTQEPECQTV